MGSRTTPLSLTSNRQVLLITVAVTSTLWSAYPGRDKKAVASPEQNRK
ncbi:hypothetical protein SeSPB_A3975 [Salmonella enterica subsp. enterica serovar Saintpaul str. SARA29]|nr:hypothetical protein SeSPB_A3975 [Salmonella enterica subsp. enterica serovar Saintpaul str. SARA29]